MFEKFLAQLEYQVTAWAPKVGVAIVVFAAFMIAGSVARYFIIRVASKADANLNFVLRMGAKVISTSLLLFGAVTALGTMGVNVSALVAGLGLTGFALGFAMKDILSNLMSGVLILLYRPFRVNDHITVTGLDGLVTDIDLRYTRLEKGDQTFLIPNSLLITNTIGLLRTK
jgi:small-conductance mechanosensitive channel